MRSSFQVVEKMTWSQILNRVFFKFFSELKIPELAFGVWLRRNLKGVGISILEHNFWDRSEFQNWKEGFVNSDLLYTHLIFHLLYSLEPNTNNLKFRQLNQTQNFNISSIFSDYSVLSLIQLSQNQTPIK